MASCWHAVHLARLASQPKDLPTGYLGHMATTSATTALVTLLESPATLTSVEGAPYRRVGAAGIMGTPGRHCFLVRRAPLPKVRGSSRG